MAYHVWRRTANNRLPYVHATDDRWPKGWIMQDGTVVAFEQLGVYDEWRDAKRRILDEREKDA